MASLPTGTVTFLFTDIEGSTTLLQRLGDRRYMEVLEEHRRLLRAAFREGNGKRSIGKEIPSWWHSRGPGRQSGRQWRPNGR